MTYDNPTPLAGPLRKEQKLSATQFGSLYSGYNGPNIFMPLLFGFLVDRIGPRYFKMQKP